jgi:hypothetical protein
MFKLQFASKAAGIQMLLQLQVINGGFVQFTTIGSAGCTSSDLWFFEVQLWILQ